MGILAGQNAVGQECPTYILGRGRNCDPGEYIPVGQECPTYILGRDRTLLSGGKLYDERMIVVRKNMENLSYVQGIQE